VEETFARLVELAHSLDAEQRRAAEEGLSEDEYILFQMLFNSHSAPCSGLLPPFSKSPR